MIVCDISSYGDTFMCQIWLDYMKGQKKIDHEVKGQRRIKIMNVRDKSSRGDRPMSQI